MMKIKIERGTKVCVETVLQIISQVPKAHLAGLQEIKIRKRRKQDVEIDATGRRERVKGSYNVYTKTITIFAPLNPIEFADVLLHEIGHHYLISNKIVDYTMEGMHGLDG
ncbi:MAG: hypothetical protein QXS27_06590 [Candidatus Jordarchaeaceae archaeon]